VSFPIVKELSSGKITIWVDCDADRAVVGKQSSVKSYAIVKSMSKPEEIGIRGVFSALV
jgi:hypothetical protein